MTRTLRIRPHGPGSTSRPKDGFAVAPGPRSGTTAGEAPVRSSATPLHLSSAAAAAALRRPRGMRRRARLRLVVLRAGRRLHLRLRSPTRSASTSARPSCRATTSRCSAPRSSSTSTRPPPRSTGSRRSATPGCSTFRFPTRSWPRGGERTARPRASAGWGRLGLPAYVRNASSPTSCARCCAASWSRPRPLPRTHRAVRRGQRADHLPSARTRAPTGSTATSSGACSAPAGARGARPRARDRSRGGTLRERVRRHDARPQAGALLRADPRPRRERRADQRRRVQGHIRPPFLRDYDPTQEEIEATIRRFTALGLRVEITEIDVTIDPSVPGALDAQAETYRRLTLGCFRVPGCDGLTTWGVTDKYTWIRDFFAVDGARCFSTRSSVRSPRTSRSRTRCRRCHGRRPPMIPFVRMLRRRTLRSSASPC